LRKWEYDFLVWKSFPSSLKIISNEPRTPLWAPPSQSFPVNEGDVIGIEVAVKQQNVLDPNFPSIAGITGWRPAEEKWRMFKDVAGRLSHLYLPTIPLGITAIRFHQVGGPGIPEKVGITWFDDLKIYQNGELIYENTFDNWLPYIIGGGVLGIVGVAGATTKLMKIW